MADKFTRVTGAVARSAEYQAHTSATNSASEGATQAMTHSTVERAGSHATDAQIAGAFLQIVEAAERRRRERAQIAEIKRKRERGLRLIANAALSSF